MTRSTRQLVGVLALMGGVTLVPARSPAQQVCGLCRDEYSTGWGHQFNHPNGGAMIACSPNTCHPGISVGFCTEWHDNCNDARFDGNKTVHGMLALIEGAIQRGDTTGLRRLMRRNEGTLVANSKTGTLDLRSCRGVLVARVPVRTALLRALRV